MPNLTTIAATEQPQSVLIYGLPFTGKSVLASSLASEGYTVHWFDADSSLKTLQTYVPAEHMHNVHYYALPDNKKNPCAIAVVNSILSGKLTRFCCTHGTIKCLPCTKESLPFEEVDPRSWAPTDVMVIDSLSQVSDSAKSIATTDLGEMDKLEFKHYDRWGLRLNILLSGIMTAPFHVVGIAHAEEMEDEDGKKKLFPTVGTRNYAPKVMKYFDHSVYTAVVNKKYVAASSAAYNPRIPVGSRSNLAMETGKITLADLLRAKPLEGAAPDDVASVQNEDGSTSVQPKQSNLMASLANLKK